MREDRLRPRSLALLASVALLACSGEGAGVAGAEPGASRAGDEPAVATDPDAPAAVPCAISAGVHHARTLEHEGDTRFYELVVPKDVCTRGTVPLIVDFHGAYGGETPEEAYRNDELVAFAQARGVVLARLRARPSKMQGATWYYWDNPSTDVEKNERFARAVIAELKSALPIDDAKIFASGYSSGGNLALSFLTVEDTPFRGIAAIASGFWRGAKSGRATGEGVQVDLPVHAATKPRVYLSIGYEDGLWPSGNATLASLRAQAYPEDRLFHRETADGHSILRWQYEEALTFFLDGSRPMPLPAKATWTPAASPTTASLLGVAVVGPNLVVADASGRLHRAPRAGSGGGWSVALETKLPITGLCSNTTGDLLASTATRVFAAQAGDSTLQEQALGADGGYAQRFAVGCGERREMAVGGPPLLAWRLGETGWGAPDPSLQVPIGAVRLLDDGTLVAAGAYGLVSRHDTAGGTTIARNAEQDGRFRHAIAHIGSNVWVVGEAGTVLRSTDGGETFVDAQSPTKEDLYSVAFRDALVGVAVGARGAAIVTRDGGVTWNDAHTGTDRMLAGVTFDGDVAIAVGESGTMLRFVP